MKNTSHIIPLLALAAFAAGCKPSAEAPATTSTEQLEKVKTDTTKTMQDVKDYTFAQKAEFTAFMKSELEKTIGEINQLEAKVESSGGTVKAEGKLKLQALRDQAAQLNQQLDGKVQNATESTWDTVKGESKKAYASLKEGFEQSRQWLSDKIAP